MFTRNSETHFEFNAAVLLLLVILAAMPAAAQGTFNSGSTGADGAFEPSQNIMLQIPESGIFNFTTVRIPAGVTVTFKKNSKNTPVTILATGDVGIEGNIVIDGSNPTSYFGGEGGPGGFRGGDGGSFLISVSGKSGEGPGGGGGAPGVSDGSAVGTGGGAGFVRTGTNGTGPESGTMKSFGLGGPNYGSRALLPLIGGSGGGGGSARANAVGGGGGGGGGAILIASSGNIRFQESDTGRGIFARGGNVPGPGGPGAGGAIRLMANKISGFPRLRVDPGQQCGSTCAFGSEGFIRLEATDLTQFNAALSNTTIVLSKPNPVMLPDLPQLRVVSVGGVNAPENPLGSFHRDPDIVLPASTSNPVTVQIAAQNIPVGTALKIALVPETGNRIEATSTPLAGTATNSTASAQLTLPASGISVITVTTTLDIQLAMQTSMFIEGERVKNVEIGAVFGGPSDITYITESGRRLKWPQ